MTNMRPITNADRAVKDMHAGPTHYIDLNEITVYQSNSQVTVIQHERNPWELMHPVCYVPVICAKHVNRHDTAG